MCYTPLNTWQETLLVEALEEMKKVSKEINQVFLIKPEEKFKSIRHTYRFYPELELLVILPTDTMADYFFEQWIVMQLQKKDMHNCLSKRVNLHVISEREFINEFDQLTDYKERVLKSRIVYDKEAFFYN